MTIDMNRYVKSKKKQFGFRLRPLDITDDRYSRVGERMCIFCGTTDLLDTARGFYVSDDTFRKFPSYVGVKAKPVIPLGSERDILTGKLLWPDFIRHGKYAWYIIEAPVCIRCMWHVLGRQRKPLKADGDRI